MWRRKRRRMSALEVTEGSASKRDCMRDWGSKVGSVEGREDQSMEDMSKAELRGMRRKSISGNFSRYLCSSAVAGEPFVWASPLEPLAG